MAAVLPGGRSPMGLVDVLDGFDCVENSQAHLESEDGEHDGAWVTLTMEGPTIPAGVCTEIGRSGYDIVPVEPHGDDNVVVELVEGSSGGGR